MIRVVLVDDQEIALRGAKSLLSEQDDIEVLGAFYTGEAALLALPKLNPDVVILDMEMIEGIDGPVIAERILDTNPAQKIIALSGYEDYAYVSNMFKLGAKGYVKKDDGHELVNAVRAIAMGESDWMGDSVMPILRISIAYNISEREISVLELLVQDLTSHEIAEHLSISNHTVRAHLRNICRKVKLDNANQLKRWARQHGFRSRKNNCN